MKFAILILILACLCSHAQTDLSSTNVVTWNSVTNDAAGVPLNTNALYYVGLFMPGTSNVIFTAVVVTNEAPVTRFYDQMQREAVYDIRVRATAFGYADSDWSNPLPVRRPRGKAGKPDNVGVR